MRTNSPFRLASFFRVATLLAEIALPSAASLGACAASTGDERDAQSSERLAPGGGGGGGGGGAGYTCGGGFCTCTGDDDCNDMYSGTACKNDGICQINSDGVPKCRCTAAAASVTSPHPVPITVIGTIGSKL